MPGNFNWNRRTTYDARFVPRPRGFVLHRWPKMKRKEGYWRIHAKQVASSHSKRARAINVTLASVSLIDKGSP